MKEIRVLDRSMKTMTIEEKLRVFFRYAILIVVALIALCYISPKQLAGLVTIILGAAYIIRSFLFWFTDDEGPYLTRPVRDTVLSFALFLAGAAFLFL
jgi:hypothetical protein